jgi:uncharacterized protein (TIGR00251 family)
MTETDRGAGSIARGWLTIADGSVTLQILARPGSTRRAIVGVEARGLIVALTSPPEKGKANDELIAVIAAAAGVARTSVVIARGRASRRKRVRIATGDASGEASRVAAALARIAVPGRMTNHGPK